MLHPARYVGEQATQSFGGARPQWGDPSMNTDPQLLVRHGVLLPPSLAPAAPKKPSKSAPFRESWQQRQRRFRRFACGVAGALSLLIVAAFVTQRLRALEEPEALRASAGKSMPVSTAISVSSKRRAPSSVSRGPVPVPAASAATPGSVLAAPIVSARLPPQKIAASESGTKAEHLGVSKPQSLSVSASAFDAPFVPPAD